MTGFMKQSIAPAVIASEAKQSINGHSGMVRKHQTRNLEIPGSMLRIAPE
jgi:hypothetical protein